MNLQWYNRKRAWDSSSHVYRTQLASCLPCQQKEHGLETSFDLLRSSCGGRCFVQYGYSLSIVGCMLRRLLSMYRFRIMFLLHDTVEVFNQEDSCVFLLAIGRIKLQCALEAENDFYKKASRCGAAAVAVVNTQGYYLLILFRSTHNTSVVHLTAHPSPFVQLNRRLHEEHCMYLPYCFPIIFHLSPRVKNNHEVHHLRSDHLLLSCALRHGVCSSVIGCCRPFSIK